MSKMATAGMARRIDWMGSQLDRIERMLKEIKEEQKKIYEYTVVSNESTSVTSEVDDLDYESAENKRLRGVAGY